jgi:cytochrome c oxidase cbb3-type subunit III
MKHLWLAMAVMLPLAGQHSERALTNPFNSPGDREQGGAFFRSQCASCHGADGRGGANGPDLSRGVFRHASSDEGLFRVINKGVPGTAMPGFSMNGREIWQIVAHVRSLSLSRTGAAAAGDAARGAAVFQNSACLKCHSMSGQGNLRGLDLTEVGSRLAALEIRQSVLDPDASVAGQYWRWEGTLQDGTEVRGRRMNEDSFSVQLVDAAGKLRTVDKSLLVKSSLNKKSAMPSFAGKISDGDLADLVAFLASKKGVSK